MTFKHPICAEGNYFDFGDIMKKVENIFIQQHIYSIEISEMIITEFIECLMRVNF